MATWVRREKVPLNGFHVFPLGVSCCPCEVGMLVRLPLGFKKEQASRFKTRCFLARDALSTEMPPKLTRADIDDKLLELREFVRERQEDLSLCKA